MALRQSRLCVRELTSEDRELSHELHRCGTFVRQRQHTRGLGIVVSVTWLTRTSRCLRARFVMRPYFIRNRHAAFIQVSEEVMVSTSTHTEGRPHFFVSHELTSFLSVFGEWCDRRVELQ